MLMMVEATTGVLYLAVMIARLVALHSRPNLPETAWLGATSRQPPDSNSGGQSQSRAPRRPPPAMAGASCRPSSPVASSDPLNALACQLVISGKARGNAAVVHSQQKRSRRAR